jgi:predicted nuclease of predicted toxin-antitoxin system
LKILLDENFPLQLYRRLLMENCHVEHIIALGQRGLPDVSIQKRLREESLLFLTQDTDFANISGLHSSIIIISHVRQNLPIKKRIEIWFSAIEKFLVDKPTGELFDLLDSGELIPIEFHNISSSHK